MKGTERQAERLREHRARLVAEGVETLGSLSRLRGTDEAETARWIEQRREAGDVVVVDSDGDLLPSWQFGPSGEPRPAVVEIVAILSSGGWIGWDAWSWMARPAALLSGERPLDLVDTDRQRLVRAARRMADRGRLDG